MRVERLEPCLQRWRRGSCSALRHGPGGARFTAVGGAGSERATLNQGFLCEEAFLEDDESMMKLMTKTSTRSHFVPLLSLLLFLDLFSRWLPPFAQQLSRRTKHGQGPASASSHSSTACRSTRRRSSSAPQTLTRSVSQPHPSPHTCDSQFRSI
jgi:hypothetical protein